MLVIPFFYCPDQDNEGQEENGYWILVKSILPELRHDQIGHILRKLLLAVFVEMDKIIKIVIAVRCLEVIIFYTRAVQEREIVCPGGLSDGCHTHRIHRHVHVDETDIIRFQFVPDMQKRLLLDIISGVNGGKELIVRVLGYNLLFFECQAVVDNNLPSSNLDAKILFYA